MAVRKLAISAVACALLAAPGAVWADGPQSTLGLIERVLIQPEGVDVLAKVDTGADNSSIDTVDWQTFEKDGATWVRFTLRLDEGRTETLERPLARMAQVRRAGAATKDRPVVVLTLCVDATQRMVEVNLSERPGLNYRMLLGASFLSGAFLVDVSQSHTAQPTCGDTTR